MSENSSSAASNPVDPWAMQRELMVLSDQHLPSTPELNKGVLLYAALNLEEGRETLVALVNAIERILTDPLTNAEPALGRVALIMTNAASIMHTHSLSIRAELEQLPNSLRHELLRKEVINIADGTTDLCVTNSGFALAMGIPAAACYVDVVGSNLSKKNPDTGKIEKTADGKWIKDPRTYCEPDLDKVIYQR